MLIDSDLDEIGPSGRKNSQSYSQCNQKIELLLVGLYIGVQLRKTVMSRISPADSFSFSKLKACLV